MRLTYTPSLLLLTLILSTSMLTACGGEDSATLVADAKTKLAAGDTKAAMIQLKNAVAEDDKNADARFELGKLYLSQHNFAGAEKEFRRAREAGLPASTVNPMIARALLAQREYQRIIDELPAPAADSPDSATLQALRATAQLGLGQKEEARKALQAALKLAPDHTEVHLALAQLALADRDINLAMDHIDLGLKKDPKHIETLSLKGDLLRLSGKQADAVAVYRDILKIDPLQTNPRLTLASIAIADNNLAEARKEVDATLKIVPNSLQARYTQALISYQEKKIEVARDQLAAVLKSAPEFGPALMLGGSIEYQLGNLQTAETYLNKVAKAAPNNLNAIRLLAATQLRLGRPDDAERTLAPALQSPAVKDAGVMVVAGEIALTKKNFAQASKWFEQAAQLNPESAAIRTELGISRMAQGDDRAMADLQQASTMDGGSQRADTLIILKQLDSKQYDAALASIAVLEKKQAANPLVWNYRAAAYMGKKDVTRARESFTQALKLDPAFFPAAANLAQLDLQAKQPDAARKRFEGVLKADPKHLGAMLALADLALRNKDEKSYLDWLSKAANAHPQELQPRIALARYQLAKGDKNKALATARDAVNSNPKNPAALDLLGTTQLALGDTTNAIASFRKLVDIQPGLAAPQVQLAKAFIISKDLAAARSALLEARRIQPELLEAAIMLGGVEIQAARFDEAFKLAKQIQMQQPGLSAGHLLEGDVAFARKDYPAAIAAFDKAFQIQPSGELRARQLTVFNAAQRSEEGEKHLLSWLATHPKDARARAALAENLVRRKQYAAAIEHYQLLNTQSPGNLVVLNNLAWSLAELNDKRALTYAEQALKQAPDNPAVLDTYGWLQTRLGNPTKGLESLKKAQAKAPDAAEIQWHLAYTLNANGDKARARQELKTLLDRRVRFSAEPEARALYQKLTVTP